MCNMMGSIPDLFICSTLIYVLCKDRKLGKARNNLASKGLHPAGKSYTLMN